MKITPQLILVGAVSAFVGIGAGYLLGSLPPRLSIPQQVHIDVREAESVDWERDAARFSAPAVGFPTFWSSAVPESLPKTDLAVIEFSIDPTPSSRRYNVYRIFEFGTDLYVEREFPEATPSTRKISRVPPAPLVSWPPIEKSKAVDFKSRTSQIRRAIQYLASLSIVSQVQFNGSLAYETLARQ